MICFGRSSFSKTKLALAGMSVGDLYFFSGLTAIDLDSLEISRADVRTQARLTLENFNAILDDLNLSLDHVIKVNAQLSDVGEFAAWNEVFLDMFDALTLVARQLVRRSWQVTLRLK